MKKLKCLLGIHRWEYFRKVFDIPDICYIDAVTLRRRKCLDCGKYQGKTMFIRDDWKDCNPNEGNTLVPLDSL